MDFFSRYSVMRLRQRSWSLLVVSFIAAWCLGFVVGPVIEHAFSGSNVTMAFFGRVCHQDPVRSFSWLGSQWAVCHRCSAIYLSFAVGSLVVFARGRLSLDALPSPTLLFALLLPVVADALGDFSGIRSSDMPSRMVTGSLTGFVLALVVLPVLFDALRRLDLLEPASSSSGGHDA